MKEYSDTIHLDNGKTIRLTTANPDKIITIGGRKIRVGDIPFVTARLSCTHVVRGIAFSVNDIVFCDKCADDRTVTEINL